MGTFMAIEVNLWPWSCWPKIVFSSVCLNDKTFFENQGGVGSLLCGC